MLDNYLEEFEHKLPNRTPTQEAEICGMQPAGTLVLTLPDQIPETSAGGIALIDTTMERDYLNQIFVTVIALGPHVWFDEPVHRAKVGDRVMIAKHCGQIFPGEDGRRYRLVNDKDVLGVVKQNEEAK